MAEGSRSVFETLNAINVNGHTEEKNGLTYLSWAWAWSETVKRFPDATYEIVKYEGRPYYFDPLTGYMVYTKVTIGSETREMWLPVMDSANNAMMAESYEVVNKWGKKSTVKPATMFDINKTIMRCLTKNLAMFGLGLYIYAGEDLPEDVTAVITDAQEAKAAVEQVKAEQIKIPAKDNDRSAMADGRKMISVITDAKTANGTIKKLARLKADAGDKSMLWNELQQKAAELGLTYDRESKEFLMKNEGETA